MEQFNTIPTSGSWADIAGILDANFLRCWTALVQSESLIGLDGSNFKGIFTSADALPEMTEPGWALVGTSLSALKLYVYNEGSTDWALLNDTTYNFTNFTEFQTQLDNLSSQVATIGSELDEINGKSISVTKGESGWTWGKYCTLNGTLGDSANWGRKSFHLLAGQTMIVTTYGSGSGIITQTSDDVNFTLLEFAPSGTSGYNAYTYTATEECDVTAFLRAVPTETKPTLEMSGKLDEIDKDINGVQNAYPNKKLSNVPGMFDSELTFVTYPIPAKAGDVVRWTPTTLNSVLSVYMNQYDADGNLLVSWNNHTADRYCTLGNDATAYIMATLFYAHQGDAKIYINGECVWSNPIFSQGTKESIEEMQLVDRYDANVPFMLDKSYFSIGSIQGSGNGAPAYCADCCYSKLIPYVGGSTITISATEAAKALIRGIRIQLRNDNDFSTTDWELVYTGYGWPTESITLPYTYKYVTFGFATVGAAAWSYEMLSGITITTDKEWSISIKELAKHIVALEDADALQDARIGTLERGMSNLAEDIEELESRADALEESLEDLDKDINGRQNAYPNKKLSDVAGIFDSETTFVTFPIPAKAGDVVRWNPITLNPTLSVYMNEYDSNGNRLGSWNNHTGVRDCTLSNSATAYIMATFFYEHQDEAKIYVNGVLAWSNPIFSQGQEERIEALENNIITNTGIVALNNPSETLLKFKQIKKPIYDTYGADTGIRQFTLLHFSDIHGIEANFLRIIEYYKAYQGYIDDVLHTGDAMAGNWANSFDFWANNADAASFLNCIGNHDTAYYTAAEGFDWVRYVGLDAYNRYFAPFISNWGVTQPTDAATNGYCYYYKDYSNSNVRLIVLDCMSIEKDGDSVQLSWFENVLADALAKGLHVVGVYHYSRIGTAIECAMQNVYKSSLPAEMPISLMDKVDAFIENGGNFVCWISGHTHRDYFGTYTCATYGHKVASVVVDTAAAISQPKFSDISRDSGTRGYDLFNIFSVDTYRKRFSVFRVGANFDSVMRHIGSITYDYDNNVLLASY